MVDFFQRIGRWVLPLLVLTTAGVASLHGEFVREVVLIDLGGRQMPDMEFDQLGSQVTWQDLENNLWVAPMDPVSGDIEIAEAEMLDSGLAPITSRRLGQSTGNGPEWVYTDEGAQILYTLQFGGPQPENWRIAIARKTGGGWETELLNSPAGVIGGPSEGTTIPGDPNPLFLSFNPPSGVRNVAWAYLNNPKVGGELPFKITTPAHWVAGERLVLSTAFTGSGQQVLMFDPVGSGEVTQLTNDRRLDMERPAMWRAPEYGNELVFYALETPVNRRSDPAQIGVYRKIAGQWTRFKTIKPPAGRGYTRIDSPEPFVYDGKSYLFMVMSGRGRGSEVWIAGIEAEDFYRKVADPSDGIATTDPEVFISDAGVFIYMAQNGGKRVFRAATGL